MFFVRISGIMEVVMRFMWIPGIRPVRVPVSIPRVRGIISWIIFLHLLVLL
jgi:hypothetical protein